MRELETSKKDRSALNELTLFAMVGIFSNLAGYVVYLLSTHLGATPKLTMTLLYGLGAVLGYFGNRNLTFAHKGNLIGSGIRYIVAHLLGYSINLVILIIFVDELGYAHQWVQALAILIVAGFLFVSFKFVVFAKSNISKAEKL